MDRKEKIIRAAISEFAEKGFEGASTNEIAKKAGVAKGLIFHYFGNKENLYIHAYRTVTDTLVNEFEKFVGKAGEKDFFQMLKEWGYWKIEFMVNHPDLANFMLTILNVPDKVRLKVMSEVKDVQKEGWKILLEKLRSLPLRNDVDPEAVLKFIVALFNGLGDMYFEIYRSSPEKLMKETEALMKETDAIFEILKHGILSDRQV